MNSCLYACMISMLYVKFYTTLHELEQSWQYPQFQICTQHNNQDDRISQQ